MHSRPFAVDLGQHQVNKHDGVEPLEVPSQQRIDSEMISLDATLINSEAAFVVEYALQPAKLCASVSSACTH